MSDAVVHSCVQASYGPGRPKDFLLTISISELSLPKSVVFINKHVLKFCILALELWKIAYWLLPESP